MTWIQTKTGKKVSLIAPDPATICLEDIAWALANQCRFNGHTRGAFYSVCEHSLRVAHLLPEELKLAGLLHDAAEAYMGDIVRPLKEMLPNIRAIEAGLLRAIAEALGVNFADFHHPQVVAADLTMLATEARDLLGPPPEPWTLTLPAPLAERITPIPRITAVGFFHQAFHHAKETAQPCV